MYKMDLALNNQQWLICHKTKPNCLQSDECRKNILYNKLFVILLYIMLFASTGQRRVVLSSIYIYIYTYGSTSKFIYICIRR